MNIDPKSETQKPDFKRSAFDYVQKNFVRNSAEAQQNFIAGADHGYSLLQSENQRLTKINEGLVKALETHVDFMTRNVPAVNSKAYGPWIDERMQLEHVIRKSKPLNHEQS